jgi:predicted N-formylglutamate amidohydrolase
MRISTTVAAPADGLLCPGDPPPARLVPGDPCSPWLLACEHAGRAVPAALGDLGVAPAEMGRHIAWDIGAGPLARRLAARLAAPLVLQRYSRLVIDCNRPRTAPDLIPERSDGTEIPANRGLDARGREARWRAIHAPFHDAIAALLDRAQAAGRHPLLVAVHSFTPCLAGRQRPWHAGFLFNRDGDLAGRLMAAVGARRPDLRLALNEPYTVDDLTDYTIPVHGEARGLPHVLLEVRNDLIADGEAQAQWADLLAAALRQCIPQPFPAAP